jgi:hypothetical protein
MMITFGKSMKKPERNAGFVRWENLPMEFSTKMMTPESTPGSSHQWHANSPPDGNSNMLQPK